MDHVNKPSLLRIYVYLLPWMLMSISTSWSWGSFMHRSLGSDLWLLTCFILKISIATMTSVELETKSQAVTLKGSAQLVKEFFGFGINSILYQRGIYPPGNQHAGSSWDLKGPQGDKFRGPNIRVRFRFAAITSPLFYCEALMRWNSIHVCN